MAVAYFHNAVGGTQTAIRNLARELKKRNITVDILTFHFDDSWNPKWEKDIIYQDDIKIIKWPAITPFPRLKILKRYLRLLFNATLIPKPGLKRLIKNYDLIHFFDTTDMTFPAFSYFVKIPKIFYACTMAETHKAYKNLYFLSNIFFKRIAEVYIASNENTFRLLKDLNIEEKRLRILPYGVDIDKYYPDESKRERDLILYVGAFEERKGTINLLESLNLINKRVKLLMAGPIRDEVYFKKVSDIISKINSEDRHKIEYLGCVDESQLIDLYQKASVFICPSLKEEFGIVNLEAMACGTPVVATQSDGLPYILENNKNGFIVKAGSQKEMAQAIEKVITDIPLAKQFGENGRKLVEDKFSWKIKASELEKIYKELLERFIIS